uniref:ATP synthase complex subunit 8 n=1 Tax=Zebrias quagga TaxID=367194 RepID=V9IN25_ZEBQU|nr:ATP synthase F0 subunit 8 [Zebrias quagga]AFB71225.1 ATP synthase subunit 8 [Zebrias quagga]
MPQLNPSPWLYILIFGWLVFLMIVPKKLLEHSFFNNPTSSNSKQPKATPWTWTWH